ncbi:MAG: PIN domain-containing protein [Terriglobales bacterium]
MSGRFFLDTNIFAYTFDAKSPAKARRAAQLVRQAVDSGQGVVSYQVVQEFFNVAFRRFQQPMTVAEAEQYLITVFRPLLAVHSSPALYVEAMRIAEKYHLSWYDCIIVAAALQGECGVLYSEDFQHVQKIDHLRIENPFL